MESECSIGCFTQGKGVAKENATPQVQPCIEVAITPCPGYLCPGLRLLGVGCGPGTITLGLAAAVAPGEVVGLDLRPEVVAQSRNAAA